jgi:hypothetical protein
MAKYKLDVENDVDDDGGEGFVLNLRYGFRFSDDIVHVRGYDTMKELRESVKNDVIPCDCEDCKRGLQKIRDNRLLGILSFYAD